MFTKMLHYIISPIVWKKYQLVSTSLIMIQISQAGLFSFKYLISIEKALLVKV